MTSKSLQPLAVGVPGHNLDSYVAAVNNVPVLSADEEYQLAERWYQDSDLEAARHLVMSHLRFVVHIARSYTGYGLPQADLIQEGNVGLMKAVKRFNPEVGVRLVSFAVHWIKAEIHEYVLRNWRIVKVATTKAQRKLFFNLRGAKKRLGTLNSDEVESVAHDLGVAPEEVREMEGRLQAYDAAFDGPQEQDDDNAPMAPVNYLEDHSGDPAETLERENWEQNNYQRLQTAMIKLDDRSKDILSKRWLGEKKATLHDLADEYQVSAERIRQLENNAIKRLRSVMEA